MAAPSFERAIKHVLKSEGGYVDHPKDPGGATNRGITLQTLTKWRGRKVTKQEVKTLSEVEAKAIYRANYWNAIKGDDLPAGLDFAVFDFAVNSGGGRAAKYLQAIVGAEADGVIGPKTVAAIALKEPTEIIRTLTKRRLGFLADLPTWPTFGKGWQKRVLLVEQEALAMAGEGSMPMMVIPDKPPPIIIPITPPPPQPASSGLFAALHNWLKGLQA